MPEGEDPAGLAPNPLMQPTNAGDALPRPHPTLLAGQGTVNYPKSFAAD
jgi:hypothetical protein